MYTAGSQSNDIPGKSNDLNHIHKSCTYSSYCYAILIVTTVSPYSSVSVTLCLQLTLIMSI